jgi:transposase InsO family protein
MSRLSAADVPGLIHHHDNGSQYLSFAFTQRLIDAGVDASVGSVGDALETPWPSRPSASSRPRRSAAKDPRRR